MKTIGRILVSVLVTAPVVVLLMQDSVALQKPVFGFSINLLAMCWWVFMVGIWQRQPALSESYYKIRPFERDGKLYSCLGVRIAKKLLQRGPLSIFNPSIKLGPGSRDIQQLESNMRAAETAHAFIFLIVQTLTLYPLVNGWWAAVASWTAGNILINAYPVLLQRYNRARLIPLLVRTRRTND